MQQQQQQQQQPHQPSDAAASSATPITGRSTGPSFPSPLSRIGVTLAVAAILVAATTLWATTTTTTLAFRNPTAQPHPSTTPTPPPFLYTYASFHLTFTLAPLLILTLLSTPALRHPSSRSRLLAKLAALAALAVAYTTPWDNYIIWAGAWRYHPSRVAARIGLVPVEEYAFFVVQSIATALFAEAVFAVADAWAGAPSVVLVDGVCGARCRRARRAARGAGEVAVAVAVAPAAPSSDDGDGRVRTTPKSTATNKTTTATTTATTTTRGRSRHGAAPNDGNSVRTSERAYGGEPEGRGSTGGPRSRQHQHAHNNKNDLMDYVTCANFWIRWTPIALFFLMFSTGLLMVLSSTSPSTNRWFYLGMIISWVAPVLTLTWWYAGPFIAVRPVSLLVAIAVPTVYLSYADHCALADEVWIISPSSSTGVMVTAHLPLEEALFFLLTNTMLVFGLRAFDRGMAVVDVLLALRRSGGGGGGSQVATEKTKEASLRRLERDWAAFQVARNKALQALVLQTFSYDECGGGGGAVAVAAADDARFAAACLRAGSKSFSAALCLFPRTARPDIAALYCLCRVCDDIADGPDAAVPATPGAVASAGHAGPEVRRARWRRLRAIRSILKTCWSGGGGGDVAEEVATWREMGRLAAAGRTEVGVKKMEEEKQEEAESPSPDDVDKVLRNLLRSGVPRCVPFRLVDELLSGFEWDLGVAGAGERAIDTERDLIDYAERVASSVGEAMLRIMWYHESSTSSGSSSLPSSTDDVPDELVLAARDLGVALQCINCARDIVTDANLGRSYLPTAWFPADNDAGGKDAEKAATAAATDTSSSFFPGVTKASLTADPSAIPPAAASHYAQRLVRLAQPYARSARRAVARRGSRLPRSCAAPVLAVAHIYMGIGDVLRTAAPTYPRRARTQTTWRVWVVVACLFGWRWGVDARDCRDEEEEEEEETVLVRVNAAAVALGKARATGAEKGVRGSGPDNAAGDAAEGVEGLYGDAEAAAVAAALSVAAVQSCAQPASSSLLVPR